MAQVTAVAHPDELEGAGVQTGNLGSYRAATSRLEKGVEMSETRGGGRNKDTVREMGGGYFLFYFFCEGHSKDISPQPYGG